MRKRKFAGIVGLVMALVMCSGAWAKVYDYPGYAPDGTSWSTWGNRAVEDYMSSPYGRDNPNGIFKSNCFMFVRLILKLENSAGYDRGYITSHNGAYADSTYPYGRELANYSGAPIITQHFNDRDGMLTAAKVEEHFSKAHTADVVQMCWGTSQHTAYINGFEEQNGKRGVRFFHANQQWPDRIIKDEFFSFETLAEKYNTPDSKGRSGGFTIYCFGHAPGGESAPWVSPPGIKISDTFPDALFREYVSYWDTNNDGYFSDDEIDNVKDFGWYGGPHPDNYWEGAWGGYEPKGVLELNVGTNHWKGIKSIEGIRIFRNLEVLYVHNDNITGAVDISGLTKLKDFRCFNDSGNGGITSINAEGCSSLEQIQCRGNKVTYINRNGCNSLTYIDIYNDTAPTIITESLPDAYIGIPYYAKVDATGTTPIYFTGGTASTLANGIGTQEMLTGQCTDGVITGTPRNAGGRTLPYTLNFPVTATNHIGSSAPKTFTITVRETPVAPVITTTSLPDAYIGEAYSAQVQATGTTPITYVINSGVPFSNGFNLDGGNLGGCTNGVIKGTPGYVEGNPTNKTPPYTVNFPITATNAGGSDTKTLTVTVRKRINPPSITTSTLPNATFGEHYYYILQASGTQPIDWSVTNGSLPPGLSLTTDGTISGTVENGASGTYSFRVTAYNSSYDYKNLTITVDVPPSVSTTGLMDGYVNESYSATLTATGATSVTWTASGLPSGLSCSSAGKITGTPTASGTFTVKVTATSSAGSSTKNLTLTIYTLPTISYIFRNGLIGQSYSDYVTVRGGKSSYTWTNDSGTIPAGLSMSPSGSSLYLKGTPSVAKTYTFRLKVKDANGKTATKDFTITIASPATAPTITTSSLPAGKVGTAYSATLSASGTTPITWSATGLPVGLSCSSEGKISGTPTKAGTFTFTAKASNSAGNDTKEFAVKITQTAVTGTIPVTITRRASYTGTPKASGGTSPYTWSISAGKLPDGLKINASTGKITGNPSKAGTFSFTVKAQDKNGSASTKEYTVKVTQTTVKGDIPTTITRRASYTGTPKVSGGVSPYTWSISAGKLPNGLKINASTGKITGNPSKAGTFSFTVKAKDKNGAAGSKGYTVKVTQTAVKGDIPATITRRASYTGTPKASGGASPYTWSISTGKLPDGLKINASTGKITGTPTKAGTFNFSVKAKDKNGAASYKAYTVKVTQTKITGTLANAVRESSYTATPKASGGASPYVWSVSSGSLPTGLKLNSSTGKITGTPTKAGTFTFTLKAKDKNGAAGTKKYTIKVTAPATKSAMPESKASTENDSGVSAQKHNSLSALPETSTTTSESAGKATLTLTPSLRIISDDILTQNDGRDNDIFTVKAGQPITFILSGKISGAIVCIDDEPVEGITISDEETFTLPAEFVGGDFKVQVKSSDGKIESQEAYIISE